MGVPKTKTTREPIGTITIMVVVFIASYVVSQEHKWKWRKQDVPRSD